MSWEVKKHHEKLRMKNGVNGYYLKDVDGKDYEITDIVAITMVESELGSFNVMAVYKDGRSKELFGCSDYDYSMLQLEKYRKEFDYLKGLI